MLAFERLTQLAPDVVERSKADSPELFETLGDDLALARDYLGGGMQVLEQALGRVTRLKHMGRTPQQCVKDEASSTMLYEEVLAALVDFDPAPETVGRELKDLDAVADDLRKKVG
jgi:hypothetical protein